MGKSWICASCRGVCCCAACTRTVKKKSTKATGEAATVPSAGAAGSPGRASSAAHVTPSSEKRSLLAAQAVNSAEHAAISSMAVPAAAAGVAQLPGPNGMSQLAYLTQGALQEWNGSSGGMGMNGSALLTPSSFSAQQQQQLLMYNLQQQQQQLTQHLQAQHLFAQQQQQQAQLVAALHMQQQQQQQQQQMPSSPYLPVASLSIGPPYPQASVSVPVPMSPFSSEHDLAASMRLHSLHEQPQQLPSHLSPSVSPATSPSTFPRTRPVLSSSAGKISSPSATKRMFLSHRDWPYASSSPLSSSRAVSETASETNSPLTASTATEPGSITGTPTSGSGGGGRGLSGDSGLSRENSADDAARMDDVPAVGPTPLSVLGGGEGRATAFAAYSSRKDTAFSNLQRLTQKDVTNK